MSGRHGKRRACVARISIRGAIFAVMAVIVLLGTAGGVVLGLRLTSESVVTEAQRRATVDLKTAWALYDNELQSIQSIVQLVAILQKTRDLLSGPVADEEVERVRRRLETIRSRNAMDTLTLTDPEGRVVLRTRPPYPVGDLAVHDAVMVRAMRSGSAAGTVIVPAETLASEAPDLASKARIEVRATPMAPPTDRWALDDGMVLKAVEAVHDDDGKVMGYVVGSNLLNRNYGLIDSIHDITFQDETWNDRPVGTVTVFQGDVRIATNVRNEDGSRAVGTLLSATVADVVLREERAYDDRAWVVNDWYLSAYEPIRDLDGHAIGVLYVGILEARYLSYRNQMVVSLLVLAGLGMLIALALAYGLSWALSRPIARLTDAARRVSEGDFMARVGDRAGCIEELALLNRTFDHMADSVVREGNELMAANQDLADTNRQYMEMLEFVTHELKSPLSSCLFAADSLREGCFGPMADNQRAVLDTMERNLSYLNEMITNYLNLSRIEKDEMQFDPQVVAVRDDVVLPVLEQIGGQVQAAGMRIRCEVPGDLRVLGDRELLKIVMDNLLSNAVKYGRRDTAIEVRAEPSDAGRARITVRNEGRGIPAADLPRLFRKFSRLDARELQAKKGTGLGLFITRQIVEAHGGTIGAESRENEWALFWVDLPAASDA